MSAPKTPEQRADWIVSKFGSRFKRLMREASDLLDSDAPLAKRGRRFVAIADALAEVVAPHAACRNGCSHCCYQSVTVTQYEADTIGAHIGVAPRVVGPIESQAGIKALREQFTGVVCPFLRAGKCSIYPVRPVACRTLFNLSDDPELCNMETHAGGTVPYFNFRPLQVIGGALAVEADASVGDIRHYFPRGRE